MSMLKRLRKRPTDVGRAGPAKGSPSELPIAAYDDLDPKRLRAELSSLSQAELAVVESHERAHQARPVVLNRLRWLTESEPFAGYDDLDTEAIVGTLRGADRATLTAVRNYERHHRDRSEVREEVERALPTAPASAEQDRAREDQAARVRQGFADRESTGADLAERRD